MAARGGRPMMRSKRTAPGSTGGAAATEAKAVVPSPGDGPVLKAAAGQSRRQPSKRGTLYQIARAYMMLTLRRT